MNFSTLLVLTLWLISILYYRLFQKRMLSNYTNKPQWFCISGNTNYSLYKIEALNKEFKKLYTKKFPWNFYNEVIAQVEKKEITDNDIKRLLFFIKSKTANNNGTVTFLSIIAGIVFTVNVSIAVYNLSNLDQLEQREMEERINGNYSETTIIIDSGTGEEKVYNYFYYVKNNIILSITIPMVISIFFFGLKHIVIARDTYIIHALEFTLNREKQ